MRRTVGSAIRDDSGATAIEYGLIAGSISIVVLGAVTLIGGDLALWFQDMAGAL